MKRSVCSDLAYELLYESFMLLMCPCRMKKGCLVTIKEPAEL